MLKSILTTLAIVGSSSVALADHPSYQSSDWRERQLVVRDRATLEDARFERRVDRERERDRDFRDRHDERARWRFDDRGIRDRETLTPYRPRTTWLALSPQVQLRRGAQAFEIGGHERFAQLRLQNQRGVTAIERIVVEFANGARQIVDGRRLAGNHAMIDIALDGAGRRIDRVIVYGRGAPGASYQLYAM